MPEYVTKEDYEKLREEQMKLGKEIQEIKARDKEREKLINRFWRERVIYISIIIGSISILTSVIVMMIW